MTNIEKAIKHLRVIYAYMVFARNEGTYFLGQQAICDIEERASEALDLLKEQKAETEKLIGFINGFSKDAVPVVRCKDCKHYRKDTCSAGAGMAFPPPDDWYCADGEQR